MTAAKFPRRVIHLSAGGTGSVPCLAISDGTNWKQMAIGANCICRMENLYPIIRRARRPLIIQDDDAGPPPAPPPVPVPLMAETGVSYLKPPRQKEKHATAAKSQRTG